MAFQFNLRTTQPTSTYIQINDQMRERYLKLLIRTLNNNAKTKFENKVDENLLAHYSLCIEEECFDKSRNAEQYTKAITKARLNIEKYTADAQLYPSIAHAFQTDCMQTIKDMPSKTNNDEANEGPSSNYIVKEEQPKPHKLEDDVIVIDSDDDDDDDVLVVSNFEHVDNQHSIDPVVLVSVETTTSVEAPDPIN